MRRGPDPAKNLRLAFELAEDAERIKLQSLRRRFPTEREEQIRQRLVDWLLKREDDASPRSGGKLAA